MLVLVVRFGSESGSMIRMIRMLEYFELPMIDAIGSM